MGKTKKCPFCGASTKTENLERHIRKVHPNEKGEVNYSEKERDELKRVQKRQKELISASSRKLYGILAVIVVVIVIAATLFYLPSEESQGEPPKVEFPEGTSYDFGTVTDPTDLSHTFTIMNNGNGVLKIGKIETSCHCTTASLEMKWKMNGPFGMAGDSSPSGWSEEIEPGDSATLHITYDTKYHGLPGDVNEQTRDIYVETNDPLNDRIKFEIKANIIRT